MIHDLYRLVFRLWRVRRFQWFLETVKPGPRCILIDVGGYWWNWHERASAFGSILCVNPGEAGDADGSGLPNVRQVVGDGCALSDPDGCYDIAFSNSVIEHVGGPDRQAAFAAEVRRVGRKVWVQTPALECPFEPHLLCLGLHWIPGRLGYLARKYLSPRAWIDGPNSSSMQDILDNTRLLSRQEFGSLFPDCRILTERILWIVPKSYIAVRE